MTSTLATNFNDGGLNPVRYLRVDREGVPLQKQVPTTVQTYTGAGGVSIDPDGSEVLWVNSALGSGALTINFTTTAKYNNYLGRKLLVYVSPAAGANVIVDVTGGGRAFRLTGDTGDQATITAGGSATFYFVDSLNCLIIASTNTTTA